MDWLAIISPAAVLGVLGLLFGGLLGVASKKFAVEVDETVANLRQYLPGANCSGCGYPSCDAFAEAVVHNGVDVSGCAVISAENLVKAGKAVGQEIKVSGQKKAVVLCQGTRENSPPRYEYEGIHSCKAAAMVSGGNKGCRYACLGNGDCISACAFGAISMGPGNIPVIDFEKCTGCGACSRKCPRNVIGMVPMEAKVVSSDVCSSDLGGQCARPAAGDASPAACASGLVPREPSTATAAWRWWIIQNASAAWSVPRSAPAPVSICSGRRPSFKAEKEKPSQGWLFFFFSLCYIGAGKGERSYETHRIGVSLPPEAGISGSIGLSLYL